MAITSVFTKPRASSLAKTKSEESVLDGKCSRGAKWTGHIRKSHFARFASLDSSDDYEICELCHFPRSASLDSNVGHDIYRSYSYEKANSLSDTAVKKDSSNASRRWMYVSFTLMVALAVQTFRPRYAPAWSSAAASSDVGECMLSFGTYQGHQYTTQDGGTVGSPTCLVESKWLKVQRHMVQVPGSSSVVEDWLWIDYHDRINVLVEDETSTESDRRFLVIEQTKYALDGLYSMAIVGGIIEPGEEPQAAARREVWEEMGGMECEEFHSLGRYRTDVNRGMGWLNSFVATGCRRGRGGQGPLKDESKKNGEEVGATDTEQQHLRTVTLAELREASRNGQFSEVQWSNTVALALQHPKFVNTECA